MSLKRKKRFSKYFFLLASILFYLNVNAQIDLFSASDLSKIKIESISNNEISNAYRQATEKGLTIPQILQIASQKGLPDAEVALLRNRLTSISEVSSTNRLLNSTDNSTLNTRKFDSSDGKIPMKTQPYDPTIFGSELFTKSSLVFEPNLRIPPPPNYMLGPDDQLIISVFGFSEQKYTLKINELGEIYIPNVGPIIVGGLTLEQATEKVRNKLASTIYKAIRTGQTKVQVTLGQIRSIRVTVIGQAKKPGTYTVSSLTTLYNILYLCGGPTDMGSYRQIEIVRGREKRTADLYDFLVYGNQKDNILLQEGDVIRIPYYKNRVTINGSIKREGKFEMLEGETFSNLLNYAGGFSDDAYRGEVTVTRITDSLRKIINLGSAQFNSFDIRGSDDYLVRRLQSQFSNRIFVTGSVLRPGTYGLTSGMTVKDLIEKAGGLAPDAYMDRALIYRYLPNMLPAIESVNLDSVFNYGTDLPLQKNDSLVISSLFSLTDLGTVEVQGSVRNPIELLFRKNLTLKDAIFSAGGINQSGDSGKIEISRRIRDVNASEANYNESKIFMVNLTQQDAGIVVLKPFDIVIVKEKPGFSKQRSVLVTGEVMSPGQYTLDKSETRISDIIERTGGFKSSADSSSLTIRRMRNTNLTNEERQRTFSRILSIQPDSTTGNKNLKSEIFKDYDIISVNLNKILNHPEDPENLQLQDGDILNISRTENLVKVSGEVYFPTLIAYQKGENLKYYVEQAGNFMPDSRKNSAMVIYPNGKVKSVKHFLFFKSYPEVLPRSEVFVPLKDKSNRTRLGATEWAVIVSALGILSNVIVNIK